MITAYARMSVVALGIAFLLPAVTLACSVTSNSFPAARQSPEVALASVLGVGLTLGWIVLLKLWGARFHHAASAQADWCDRQDGRRLDVLVIVSAGVSLLLELTLIRWQGTVFELFAFYKNLNLLACFAGLGLGYALAGSRTIPLSWTAPLVGVQVGLLLLLRHGFERHGRRSSLNALPVDEQLEMGLPEMGSDRQYLAMGWFLVTVFLLTALALIPVGQWCGRLMARRGGLRAYGGNLIGSMLGVLVMFGLSAVWSPPLVWFLLALGGVLVAQHYSVRVLGFGVSATLGTIALLGLPWELTWERIYSPYQLIERGPGERGLMMIQAAGYYYQRVHDLSAEAVRGFPDRKHVADYYEFAYRVRTENGLSPGNVLIVGAGSGNDVAAALRRKADRVVAVEIDPAIILLGKTYHPEQPYADPRVAIEVNDARSYLRRDGESFDMIVYGLLDSHSLLSHVSNVRVDSFVYTVEGLREARMRLKPGGMLSLSFCMIAPEIGRKISRMLTEAFDGQIPLCVKTDYDASVTFLVGKDGPVALDPKTIQELRFENVTQFYGDTRTAEISTDDWPFLYMPKRIYPTSYLMMTLLILVLSGFLVFGFRPERPAASDGPMFFLGAGFMLLQTKAVTELGLTFGNTWSILGVVILSMLGFAFLANLAVAAGWGKTLLWPGVGLLGMLVAGYFVSLGGGLGSSWAGRWGSALVLTGPVFFSGIVFSRLLSQSASVSAALAVNLTGALAGGLLEYHSMYYGFRVLYVLAFVLYAIALIWAALSAKKPTGEALPAVDPQ